MALIVLLLEKSQIDKRLNLALLAGMRTLEIPNRDVAHSYIGLLCQGISDFDHIEPFREDDFFPGTLQIHQVPSSSTLRQRLYMASGKSSGEPILPGSIGNAAGDSGCDTSRH